MAAIDPGEAGVIKSQDHSRASLQVIRRFCLTVSSFAVWAMARQQLDPMLRRDGESGTHALPSARGVRLPVPGT